MFTEILTGAASASDEYVQIEATGEGVTLFGDVELIYRSASGLTTRRLVSLAALPPLAAGGRLLLANAAMQRCGAGASDVERRNCEQWWSASPSEDQRTE